MGAIEATQQTVTDWVALHNQVQHALLRVQAAQKYYADAQCHDVSINFGNLVCLATKNLQLQVPCKLQDHSVGPFRVMYRTGEAAYKLYLSGGCSR